jgi:hypothetical protein
MAGESGLQMWRVLTASRTLEDHEHTTMWVRTLSRSQKEKKTKNSRRRREV